ncbi:MAG TPA: cytidine deaminase [Thermoleophilia bacterium]|nr:cytidine deaminase [Thermoleophilia bacterium]
MNRAPDLGERLLYQEALSLTERAYAPYSGFAVGAVVVGPSGRSHHGVNVENASYPAGLCAERAALAALVAFGERRLRYVAVAASGARDCLPCGLCLQALSEFGDPEVIAQVGGEVRVTALRQLLSTPFVASRPVAGVVAGVEAGDAGAGATAIVAGGLRESCIGDGAAPPAGDTAAADDTAADGDIIADGDPSRGGEGSPS